MKINSWEPVQNPRTLSHSLHADLHPPSISYLLSSIPYPQVTGDFQVQDAVQLCDEDGAEIARALTNFSSEELNRIVKGRLWRSDMAQSLG